MKKTSTVKKAKSGTSLGMKSVKAGYDKNPGVTRADIISAATGKAKNGAKVASKKMVAKKPIKKAQDGTKMLVDGKEYESGAMLPEAVVTASRITDKPSKPKRTKDWTRKVYRVNKQAIKASGAGAKKVTNIFGMRKRYEEGGDVSMAKKGASVKKAMGKCKSGC